MRSIRSQVPSNIKYRPYLGEVVSSGDGFNIGSFMAMVGFAAVILFWLYSARGLVTGFAGFLGLGRTKLNATTGQVEVVATPQGQIVYESVIGPGPTPTPGLPFLPTVQPAITYQTEVPTSVPVVDSFLKDFPNGAYYADGFYSWYWPPFGGINCDQNPDGSDECTYLANGDRFDFWIDRGCACPAELPFGTRIYIKQTGDTYICVDRGGAIVVDGGAFWIDVLTDKPDMLWSSPIDIVIYQD